MLTLDSHRGSGRLFASGLHAAFEGAMKLPELGTLIDLGIFVGLFALKDWKSWLPDAHAYLSPAERRRVASRRAEADRDALAMAYALHRLLLGRALNCEASLVPLVRDEAGCPRLPGCLLSTSLSHADRRAVAIAVTTTGPVGVDLEPASRSAVMPQVGDWIFHPGDAKGMECPGTAAHNAALLALWVRKEAFLKAAGIGLSRDMNTFPAPENALLDLPEGGSSRVRMIDAGPNWVAAVAGAPGAEVTAAWLSPTPSPPVAVWGCTRHV